MRMDADEQKEAKRIFSELEEDLVGWCYSVEMWFCPEHTDKKGNKLERWHVQLVGQNNWNDEPWGEQYTFNAQQDAWLFAKKLGDKWML